MNCPVCGESLREVQRSGVSIDVCPRCKGVWLDRGELEKILALEASGPQRIPATGGYVPHRDEHDDEHHGYREHDDEHHGYREHGDEYDERYGRHRKRRGFLGGIFESLGGDD